MKSCSQCSIGFEIREEDRAFYQKMKTPEPTLCSSCRLQRRFAFRNERKLYRRKCDLTKKEIISFHHADKPFPVYDHHEWWSDRWDPLDYGRDFDFNRPFFEQFADLQKTVPRISMTISHCENSDYGPYCVYSKNCYMCISCLESEDLYYCYQTHNSKDCVDCSITLKSELAYECIYCTQLFNSAFCQNCEEGSNLYFCQDCRGCSNLIGCKNLVNQKYHVFNKPVSKEEFDALRRSLSDHVALEKIARQARAFFLTQPQRAGYLVNCENSTGDHLRNCRNTAFSFECQGLEDCAYLYNVPIQAKDCQDIHYSPRAELVYDSMSAVNNYHTKFILHSWDIKESTYVDECFFSDHLFGCIGLRQKKYCIFNKQYPKEDYEALLLRIIEHMRKTGEHGEFFPMTLSPFGYNETLAQDYFPLTKEAIISKGLRWKEQENFIVGTQKVIPAAKLPDRIDDIPDDILNWAIQCESTGRSFRITPQELAFYRKSGLFVPRLHPDERYKRRMAFQSTRQSWDRTCSKCSAPIQTTYSPDRPEKVYCEQCYLKEVY